MAKDLIQKAGTQAPAKSMKDYVNAMSGEIAKALPSVMTPERFTRIVLSALSSTPQLQSCTPKSFLGAMMQAAQLGLEPNTPLGQAYLLPYKNHGVDEVQFQLGYKGLIDLAYRSGEVASIQAHTVYSGDQFSYSYGLDPKLEHVPALSDRGEPIAYYAVFKTKDGGFGFQVMSRQDVEAHARKHSKSYTYGGGPWKTSFDEMAKKTVLKACLKYAPMRTEFARQLATDETIRHDLAADMTEVPDATDYTDVGTVDETTGEVTQDA